MKIYWKNVLWNCTVYFWYRWKYRHSPHRKFFAPLRYWTEKEKIESRKKMEESVKKTLRDKVEKRSNKGKRAEEKFAESQQKILEKFKEAFRNTKINGVPMNEYYGVRLTENESEQLNQSNNQSNNQPTNNTN